MADRILNIGFIGNGKSTNRYHAPFALALPDKFRVHSIQARHIDHEAWEAIPGAAYLTDTDELLANPEIDIVEITTPSHLHYSMAKRVLEAGKHCVVDKPFASTAEEAEELFALAAAQGVTVQCYQNRRFDSDFLTAQKVFESGKLGRVFEIVGTYDYFRPLIMEKLPFDRENSAPFGHGSHTVDQIISWLGVPDRWQGDCKQLQGEGMAINYFDYDFFYDDLGIKATAAANYFMATLRPAWAIYGTRGSFIKYDKDSQERDLKHFYLPAGHDDFGLDTPDQWGTLVYLDENGVRHEERVETVRSTYSGFYEALYETVAKGAPQLVKPEETLAQMRILSASIEGLR